MMEDVETAETVEQSTQQETQAQTQAVEQRQTEQKPVQKTENKVPSNLVPVAELAKERNKAKTLEERAKQAEAKALAYEQKEQKRGFYKEALSTLGDNWKIDAAEDLDAVIDALAYNEQTKDVIAKLVNAVKKPAQAMPSMPMFGTVSQQNATKEASSKFPEWEALQQRLNTQS